VTQTSRLSLTCSALLITLCAGDAWADPAPVGNPYSFHGSVAECAAAERSRCDDCLARHTCTPITDARDGDAECTQLAEHDDRGYFLICINLALAIDAVDACTGRGSPCPRDQRASESLSSLEANASFLDDPACAAPLDACLAALYGAPNGGSPGPGSDVTPPQRNRSVDCGDSCNGDSQADCDAYLSCDASDDTSCSDSGESSSCDDSSGGEAGGDSCSGDSEDSCGSEDSSSCDDSDCGGGGDSDCSSSSGGGGGDCSGGDGGGDCSGGGGGGDCGGGGGGGGGDCNVAARRGRIGTSLPVTLAWAALPIPIAILVRRRAERRRARAASGDAAGTADGDEREVQS
jgi:hypothetical protein